MASNLPGGGVSSGKGGITLTLVPPIEFILKQSGEFRHALDDLLPLWELFEPIMEEIETEQFDTEGHGSWPALAESTLRQKEGGAILVRTGELKASLTGAGAASTKTPKTMTWGTDVAYAHFHQTGGYVAGRPPQRQVIPDPFPPEDRQKLEAAMVTYVNLAARATFGRIAA